MALKWVLRYVRGTVDVGLLFGEQKEKSGVGNLVGYVDSDFVVTWIQGNHPCGMCLFCLEQL